MSLRPNDYHLRHRNLQADETELGVKEKLNLEIGGMHAQDLQARAFNIFRT
jgi:hypothetical protein